MPSLTHARKIRESHPEPLKTDLSAIHVFALKGLDKWCQYWHHFRMSSLEKIIDKMHKEPLNVRFSELLKVCEEFFGKPRQGGTSHVIFKTPWPSDPRINLQNNKGKAKAYQVRQVLLAIEKLREFSE